MQPLASIPTAQPGPTTIDCVRRPRRPVLLALALIGLSLALHTRSLWMGFVYDDYIHQFMLRQAGPDTNARFWNLYDFGTRPKPGDSLYKWGFFPWWTDPDFKIRFFRPLTSLSLSLDYVLYGDWAPGHHLTNLLLFGGFLFLAYRLYLAVGAPAGAALWALAFLALDDSWTLPVAWIANRNTPLAAMLLVGCVLLFDRYRRSGHLLPLFGAMLTFLGACTAKESGIIGLPLLAAYLLFLDPVRPAAPLTTRLASITRPSVLWLFAVLAAAYAVGYIVAGYGTHTLFYPAPWAKPGLYLMRLLVMIPLAISSLFFGISADLPTGMPTLMPGFLVLGLLLTILLFSVLHQRLAGLPAARFGACWLLICLIPEAGAELSDRLFMCAGVGSALLAGLFVDTVIKTRRERTRRSLVTTGLAAVLVVAGPGLAALGISFRYAFLSRMMEADRQAVRTAEIDRSAPGPRNVFILNTPTSMLASSMLATWSMTHNDRETAIHFLQMGRRAIDCRRIDRDSLLLTAQAHERPFGDHRLEILFRTGRPVVPNEILYTTLAYQATPLVVEPTGIRSVLLRFKPGLLEQPSCQFLIWRNQRLERIPPPPVGESLSLPEIQPTDRLVP